MSMFTMENDYEDLEPTRVSRLDGGFALRDLIAGTEFQINDQVDDYEERGEREFEESKRAFASEELEKYWCNSALDVDTDENDVTICFSELRKKMTPITPDGKIMKRVKHNGLGDVVPPKSVVYYHYSAHVNLEPEPFDNSYLRRKRPERLPLGKNTVILGLEIAIKTMRKGEIAQFIIESDYAFGKFGCPPRVPPDATVCFEVELVSFVKCSESDIIEDLEADSVDSKHPFDKVLKAAKYNHVQGNDLYKQDNPKSAVVKYKKAVDLLLDVRMDGEDQEERRNKLLLKLYSNLSVCYKKMNQPQKVCIACREAFYVDPKRAKCSAKIVFNWGAALVMLGDYEKAADKLKQAKSLAPNDVDIRNEIIKLEQKRKEYAQQEKIRFKKSLGLDTENSNEENNDYQENTKASQELLDTLKATVNSAKKGKPVELTLPPEVLESIRDVCEDLVAEEGLTLETKGNTITISKPNNNENCQ